MKLIVPVILASLLVGIAQAEPPHLRDRHDLEQPCARLTAPNKSEVTLANRKIRWLSELRPNEAVFRLQELAQSR